ncbi:TIGR02594 family protein [Phreatobacter stygius]|uniref:TIGR02594 family protein n=1 Tax=Phreatobacter stygius TaxID=1940610 RepID=A0A4D7BCE3_9HYPH|nr:TIGR02594 family protein [Phreatobacter stygius]QCI65647.1 TIGR02594 family protein [Phreatobacter stygius]
MSKASAKAPHLDAWPLPPWLRAAIEEIGTAEVPGPKSNPRIVEYRKLSGINLPGDDGAVPWCAIFVNAMLAKAGVAGSGSGMARSFTSSPNFERLAAPVVGCITVFSSTRGPASGHVNIYTAENGIMFQGIGGNQNDEVSISMFPKSKLVGHFWPKGHPKPNAPFDQQVRLTRPLLPHERKAGRDV